VSLRSLNAKEHSRGATVMFDVICSTPAQAQGVFKWAVGVAEGLLAGSSGRAEDAAPRRSRAAGAGEEVFELAEMHLECPQMTAKRG
jgi:hypothetical protein